MDNKDGLEKRHRRWRKILVAISLVLYLILLFYFLFFAEILGRTYEGRTYHYNLVPFREIKRFWEYRETLGMFAVTLNLLGNVVAFMPFGMLIPALHKKCKSLWYTVLLSFELSLAVELIQLVSKVGSCDVDDLILNTFGGFCGYLLYQIISFIRRKYHGKKR